MKLKTPIIKKVIFYYDEVNPRTGKKKHSWPALQHTFQAVKSRSYIERFRKYIESTTHLFTSTISHFFIQQMRRKAKIPNVHLIIHFME